MIRKIVLDTETTGLSYISGDRIVEIAAIELIDDKETSQEFQHYVNPECNIPKEVIAIHGITNEFVADKPKFSEIVNELIEFIGDSPIIAHNSEFDRGFINMELSRLNKSQLPKSRFINTLKLAAEKFKGESISLDNLCKKFNIDLTSRKNNHGAIIDTRLLAKVYSCLIKNNAENLELNIQQLSTSSPADNLNKKKPFEYRRFDLKEEDIKSHESFLKNKMKNHLWINK